MFIINMPIPVTMSFTAMFSITVSIPVMSVAIHGCLFPPRLKIVLTEVASATIENLENWRRANNQYPFDCCVYLLYIFH